MYHTVGVPLPGKSPLQKSMLGPEQNNALQLSLCSTDVYGGSAM